MESKGLLSWYDLVLNSELASGEEKEAVSESDIARLKLLYGAKFKRVLDDLYMDEELGDLVNDICKGILDYISPDASLGYLYSRKPYMINPTRIDLQTISSSGSGFLAFSKKYNAKFKEFIAQYSRVGVYPIQEVLPKHDAKTSPIGIPDDEEYKKFKRFDTVEDYSDHLFFNKPLEVRSQDSTETIHKDLKLLEEGLPETIFVRLYKSRMDLLRAAVIGPKGTPYHDGLFFFDVYFPPLYPLKPPLVRYHSCGFGINPHLFECGEFRFNLIRSWTPSINRIWTSHFTTVLDLLVSIQDKVLNADPLFHQPGFLDSGPSVDAEYFSLLYNEHILIKSLKTMMHIIKKPPNNFEAFVAGHFRSNALVILRACEAYIKGVRVGCDVDNKESCCSAEFQNEVASCFTQLVYCFKDIGAAQAENFIQSSALAPKSVLGSPTMYKPEPSRRSPSTSAAVYKEKPISDVNKRAKRVRELEARVETIESQLTQVIENERQARAQEQIQFKEMLHQQMMAFMKQFGQALSNQPSS